MSFFLSFEIALSAVSTHGGFLNLFLKHYRAIVEASRTLWFFCILYFSLS